MATTPTVLPATIFTSITTTIPDQPAIRIANLTPNAPPPVPATVNTSVATIQQAIASDKAANTPGTTALPPPNNFTFTDLTVNVSGATPGDTFKGSTPGITAQVVDLTPDNLLIQATAPNTFIKTDSGNDLLTASGGRNILSAGSGANILLGGSGQDTFLADASKASSSATILHFASTDDVAMLGVSLSDFAFSVKDTLTGLEIDAAPTLATNPISAQITLQGFTVADIGTKLSLGVGSTTDGTSFLFVHGN